MLGKLLKYEYKATGRIFLILYPALIILAITTKFFNMVLDDIAWLSIPKVVITITYVIMIVATLLITFVLSLQRFYKNLLCEEGYLQFTLPVSASSQILSKLIVSVTWYIASTLAIISSIAILIPAEDYKKIVNTIKELIVHYGSIEANFKELTGMSLGLFLAILLGIMLFSSIELTLQTYTAMSLGQLANKNRLPIAFGCFLGLNFVKQIVSLIGVYIVFANKYEKMLNEFT